MALLSDILYGVSLLDVVGTTDVQVNGLTLDSRACQPGFLFAALKGTQSDGHTFIDAAIQAGASVILCEKLPAGVVENAADGLTTFIRVKDSDFALGLIADNFFGSPSKQLQLTGVTGTNGKTSVATMLHRMFELLGYKSGLLSTIENRIGSDILPATHTTPDVIQLNSLLSKMLDGGCTHVFMEVSSHAIVQKRIAGLHFTLGVFTNISRDHLDYHGTFKSYIEAKKQFFDGLGPDAYALINADDRQAEIMTQNCQARVKTFAVREPADYRCRVLENSFDGLLLRIDGMELHSLLVGNFNAYNITAVYAGARLLNVDAEEALRSISGLGPAEGRFERIRSQKDHIIGIIDYAHTPDALEKVLDTLRDIRAKGEKLITVVGCGGDRDRGKRPLMAATAANLSDKVIITSDNPRSEDPSSIIKDMEEGIPGGVKNKAISIENRREAIKAACMLAAPQDIILLAGKGHEKYQEIKGQRFPFDDRQILVDTLKSLER